MLPAVEEGFDGLVEQAVDVSWHRRWDLAMGGESPMPWTVPHPNHAAAQHLRLGRARRLTRRDGVVHEIPVGDSGLLETWMISLGHERAVREIVDVWLVTNELDVGVNQRVQLPRCVITGHRGEKERLSRKCTYVLLVVQPTRRDSPRSLYRLEPISS